MIARQPATQRLGRAVRDHRGALLGLLAYLALGLILTHAAWGRPGEQWIGKGEDPAVFTWDLRWVPFALLHGHDPFLSNYVNAPHGVNLMWNTSILWPGLVMAPFTLTLGPVVAYNLLAVAALAGSAWTASWVLGRWASPPAAWIGGLLYGFSPLAVSQTLGHPNLTILVLPPLVLGLLDDVIRARRSPRAVGVAIGLLAALQLVTGEEILALTAVAGMIGLLWLCLLARGEVRRRAPAVARTLALAAAVGLLVGAIPLAVQFLGPQHPNGRLQPRNVFVLDLKGPIVPTEMQWIHSSGSVAAANQWTGGRLETNGYLGLLAPVLAAIVWFRRRERVVLFAGGVVASLLLLSLGPSLHIDGRDTGFPLPWSLFGDLPVAENMLPARLMLLVYLFCAMLLAIAVDRLSGLAGWRRGLAIGTLAGAVATLLPTASFPATAAPVPSLFTSSLSRLPHGATAMLLPYASSIPMLWQAEAGMRFRITGGEFFTPTAFGPAQNAPDALSRRLSMLGGDPGASTALSVADRQLYLATLRVRRVAAIMLGPSSSQARVAGFLTHLLGRRPEAAAGDMIVFWDLRGV